MSSMSRLIRFLVQGAYEVDADAIDA